MREFLPPTPLQRQQLAEDIGRPPEGDYLIALCDQFERALVVQVPPFVNNIPFPTVFWLCCPKLKKKIDQLESHGLIKELEQRVQTDEIWREAIAVDHQRYRDYRVSLITQEHRQLCDNPNKMLSLETKGVGGVDNWQQIRCLHMHYAHHLIFGNTVGRYLDEHHLN